MGMVWAELYDQINHFGYHSKVLKGAILKGPRENNSTCTVGTPGFHTEGREPWEFTFNPNPPPPPESLFQ